MYLLYEISIIVAGMIEKRRLRRMREDGVLENRD